jgi:hypothetical protein
MATTIEELKSRIEALEKRVAELTERQQDPKPNSGRSFRDFYGCLKGKLNATEELLEECRLKIDWDQLDPPE